MLRSQRENIPPQGLLRSQGRGDGGLMSHWDKLLKVWQRQHNIINLGYHTKDILMTIHELSFKVGVNINTLIFIK